MEKFFAVVVIIFPGILAIDHNGDDVRALYSFKTGADILEAVDHVLRGILTGHAGVGKADFV